MARPVGSLAVRLTADTSEFQRRMNRATRNIRSMGRQMRSAVNTAGKYAAAITAAGAAITTHLVANAIRGAREVQNLARISDTSVKSFQQQAFAAQSVGIEAQKLADIYKDMNDRVGDFLQTGGGPMADFFETIAPKVGVTAEQFRRLSGPQALQLFVDSLERANLSQSEMTFHMEAIASDATALLPLLRSGGKEMRVLAEQADAVGFALLGIEVQQLVETQKAIDTVGATLDGVIKQVAVQLSPLIQAAAEEFQDAAVETEGFSEQIDQAVRMGVKGAQFIGNAWRGIQVIIKGLELGFSGFNLLVLEIARGISQAVTDLVTDAISKINFLSEAANNIPGIDIPLIDDSGIRQTQQFLNDLAASARDKVERTKDELHDLLMEPLPTAGLEEWVASVQEASRKVAEAIREEQARNAAESREKGGQGDPEAEARKEQLESRLNQLREGLMSEREVELEHQMQRGEILREAFERDLLTFQEFKRLTEEAAAAHQKRMTDIEKEGLSERQKFQRMGLRSQAKTIFGQLDNITAGVSQHNKELFRLNQIAGIANAIINAYEGISKTLSTYPYPLNIAMAAAHATAAFAQVNAIRSATFSGGGGTAPSLSGGTAAPPSSEVGRDGGGRQQSVMINLRGSESSTFTRQQVRDLIEQINEASDDGAQVVVS